MTRRTAEHRLAVYGSLPVKLFESPDPPAHWRRLDAFEGDAYRRVVVPVSVGDGDLPANIYVVAR
jgi:hypothetical protein